MYDMTLLVHFYSRWQGGHSPSNFLFAIAQPRATRCVQGGGDGVGGMAGLALFFDGIAGSTFFFGGMAGFELLAGCDITNLFWLSVIFRQDGGIGTRSRMENFLFLQGSYLVYKDNSIQRFSGEELLSNVSSVCVRP